LAFFCPRPTDNWQLALGTPPPILGFLNSWLLSF
jgi:hypothetical protein